MTDRMRAVGLAVMVVATTLAGGALSGTAPGASAADPDCVATRLDAVETQLAIARASSLAGDPDGLRVAIEAARTALDAIAATCLDIVVSPEPLASPSRAPVDLGGSGTVGGRAIAYPADLVLVEDGLMRPVDDDDLRAAALTLADSRESGDILRSDLQRPVPATFRLISLAVGDPPAVLASVGVTDPEDTVPSEPSAALGLLVAAIGAGGGEVDISFGEVSPFPFPEGAPGARVDFEARDEADTVLVSGAFLLRPVADGDWVLGVGFAAPAGIERLRAELAATLASIGPVG